MCRFLYEEPVWHNGRALESGPRGFAFYNLANNFFFQFRFPTSTVTSASTVLQIFDFRFLFFTIMARKKQKVWV